MKLTNENRTIDGIIEFASNKTTKFARCIERLTGVYSYGKLCIEVGEVFEYVGETDSDNLMIIKSLNGTTIYETWKKNFVIVEKLSDADNQFIENLKASNYQLTKTCKIGGVWM